MGFLQKLKEFFLGNEKEQKQERKPVKEVQKNGHFVFRTMNIEFDIPENFTVRNIEKTPNGSYRLTIAGSRGGYVTMMISKGTEADYQRMVKKDSNCDGRRCVAKDITKADFKYEYYVDEYILGTWRCVSKGFIKLNNTLIRLSFDTDVGNEYATQNAMMGEYYVDKMPNEEGYSKNAECDRLCYDIRKNIKWIE